MKTRLFLILLLYSTCIFSQEKKSSLSIGIFAGEPTGMLIEKYVSNKLSLELNYGINEIFYKYNYIKKYKIYYQDYDRIFSTGINTKYTNISKKINWNIIIGTTIRIIYNYTYQHSNKYYNLPPGTIISDDPITRTKVDLGLNGLIGVGYPFFNNRYVVFMDCGGYFEIIDKFLWNNFQFRIGIKYIV